MDSRDVLTIGEVARRSGFAASALRYYESEGLIHATRAGSGQRRFERGVLRRLAFIRAAGNVGLSLAEIRTSSPASRPTAPPAGPTGNASLGTGAGAWTSRSPPSSDCGPGWTPASAADACPCNAAPCPIRATGRPMAPEHRGPRSCPPPCAGRFHPPPALDQLIVSGLSAAKR